MQRRISLVCGLILLSLADARDAGAQVPEAWPQFRGPNGASVATSAKAPPIEFGPGRNVLWTTALPPGHSSPVIWGDRIFVTAFDTARKKLEVIALRRATGEIAWRRDVPAEHIEDVHKVSSPATGTPVADAERVYAYFGSYGLIAFGHDGTAQWTVPMPTVQMPQGSGTSPVLAGDVLILNRQEPKEPFIAAFDRKSGAVVWKQPHDASGSRGAFSHATPAVLGTQVIIHGVGGVQAHDLKTGARRWWAAMATNGTSSPTIDGDTIYVATWSNFGEADQRIPLQPFAAMLKYDADGDGLLSPDEIPADLTVFTRPDTPDVPGATMTLRTAVSRVDANKDGKMSADEWNPAVKMVNGFMRDHGLLALGMDGTGDVSATHVKWRENTAIPEVPSPLAYRGRVYMIRNGGILTSLDARTGTVVYRSRIDAGGPYYASPVAVGDRVFLLSGDGVVTVVATGDQLSVVARNDLGEPIFASPAVVDGVLYVRTASALRAFGTK